MTVPALGTPEHAPTPGQLETALEVLRIHDVLTIGGLALDELVRVAKRYVDGSTSIAAFPGNIAAALIVSRAQLIIAIENQTALNQLCATHRKEAERNLAEVQRLDLKLAQQRAEIEEVRATNVALSREGRR